ncbi:MAG TPA: hypothetical protein HPQ04_09020 [Rhodospirillaceae bacterium]|nr:hypothetical protein [Rhodospirillaceae bacterium]
MKTTPRPTSDSPKSPDIPVAQVVDGIEDGPHDQVKWIEENKEALAQWSTYFEENGLPLTRYRQF